MSDSTPNKWMVCVSCITYNHAPLIIDAMNGFCMQETDFPYVCVIVDDCSTDGEQEVIRHYLEEHFEPADQNVVKAVETNDYSITFARNKSNKNCFFAVYFLKYNHYQLKKPKALYQTDWRNNAQYIAMCEGDDYWTHERKLQTQVDYMEQHKSVNIYTHNAIRTYPNGCRKPFNEKLQTGIYNLRQCLRMKWFTPTASFLYRSNITISPLWRKNRSNGDMAILYTNLLKGDLYYSDVMMSVYRYSSNPFSMSATTPRTTLYKKKRGMLKTINQLSNYKYIMTTLPLISMSYVKQTVWSLLIKTHLK